MALTVFKDSSYSLSTMIEEIERGEIALPDIQRPFVWKSARVRDLFDSMYRGFPVGHLLFWATGAEAGARKIGVAAGDGAPRLMIVDGQQRLTSLFAVLTGKPIIREDYCESRIRIAFRPKDRKFEVADAAIAKDPEFIPDISVLWESAGRRKAVKAFLDRLEASRGALDEEEEDRLEEAIDQLYDLRNYPFKVMELSADIDEEQVADIFVRINSEGVRLAQADFILTLMSVWWDEGRKDLERFARDARRPGTGPSPANPFIDPSADQLLRVAAGVAFRRGRLRYVYQVLRGKDLETGEVSPAIREIQFAALKQAQESVLSLTNWHEFLKAVRRAGYRSGAMITSRNNLLFSYLMYLIGHRDHGLDRKALREAIARWFFMTSLTGRYTGNFESQVEVDLRKVGGAENGEAFVDILDGMIDTELTGDFWEIQLPNALDTSASYSPTLFGYHASLVLLNARPLFSPLTMAELLDPATHAPRSAVERHHLFPKAYLSKLGIDRTAERNQIANFAFVEWPDNASIRDKAPAEYFPPLWATLSQGEQKQARFWHALPEGWEGMEYREFLEGRRGLISNVVRAAFEKLRTGTIPQDESEPVGVVFSEWTVEDLLEQMETETIEFKSSAFYTYVPDVPEKVIMESVIKTIAGFLNAGGGTLAIGIADDGEILGIGPDLEQKNMDSDRYVNALTTIITSALGPMAATLVKIQVQAVNGEQVCLVHVPSAPEPIYAKVSKGDQVFFVRVNNSTRMLEGAALVSYVKGMWG